MERIALCGVFDIPNYGDHLFPLIVRNELRKRGCDYEVVLFSPSDARECFVEDSHIHSLDDMERMHQEQPFRAIIVGGGEIIHWHRYQQKYSFSRDSFRDYPMDKVWIVPFMMKLKYNVPLIWNAPGIPYDYDIERQCANFLFSNIDYISVRNTFSKEVLQRCGVPAERIHQIPDTGFALGSLAAPADLARMRGDLQLDEGKYVVFHCNRFISKEDEDAAFNALNGLHDKGYAVYLLPLAYTHGDDAKLAAIRDRSGDRFRMPESPLSLFQIIAVLSGCAMYVGTSLHGTVTASVYGRKVVSFDYQQTKKTHDLYNTLGLGDYYVTDGSQLARTVDLALKQQRPVDFTEILDAIKQHFDTIVSVLDKGECLHPNPTTQASQFSDMAFLFFTYAYECEGLRKRVKELTEALDTNLRFVEIFKGRSEYLQQENDKLQQEMTETLDYKLNNTKSRLTHRK